MYFVEFVANQPLSDSEGKKLQFLQFHNIPHPPDGSVLHNVALEFVVAVSAVALQVLHTSPNKVVNEISRMTIFGEGANNDGKMDK